MKKIKNIALIGMIAAGALCSSCSEDFLKPDPLSFYEPEQTFTTEAGLRSVVATLDRHLRNYWTYYQAATGTIYEETAAGNQCHQPTYYI